jgi:hypothetical protein
VSRSGCSTLPYLSTDGGTMLIAGQQQQFLFLETIVEETSDDLRSESDRSGPAGWPDSDSDTESVIHVPNSLGMLTVVCFTMLHQPLL